MRSGGYMPFNNNDEAIKSFSNMVSTYQKETRLTNEQATFEEMDKRIAEWFKIHTNNEKEYIALRTHVIHSLPKFIHNNNYLRSLTKENKLTEFMPLTFADFLQKNEMRSAAEMKALEPDPDFIQLTEEEKSEKIFSQQKDIESLNSRIQNLDKILINLKTKNKKISDEINNLQEQSIIFKQKHEEIQNIAQHPDNGIKNRQMDIFLSKWEENVKNLENKLNTLEISVINEKIMDNINIISLKNNNIRNPDNLNLEDFNDIIEMRKYINLVKEQFNNNPKVHSNLLLTQQINGMEKIIADLEEKSKIQKQNIQKQKPKFDTLFNELEKRREEAKIDLPDALKGLITPKGYQEILDYIVQNRSAIEVELAKGPYHLAREKNKREGAAIDRSVNFIIDPKTGNFQLILETKSKIVNDEGKTIKNEKTPVFSGSFKTTKAAYRIDTKTPIKMANAVLYVTNQSKIQEKLAEGQKEVRVSQHAAEGLEDSKRKFINESTLGQERIQEGIRPKTNKYYYAKQSQYSEWADCGDLDNILKNPEKYPLTSQDKNDIANSIIDAVKILHDKNIVHHDIKPANILIYSYEDQNGNTRYYGALSDYGLSHDPTLQKGGGGTPLYTSPEKANNKSSSGKKDDMWAVGLVLYQVYNNVVTDKLYDNIVKELHHNINLSGIENESPLITGLLSYQNKRFDIDQAKDQITSKEKYEKAISNSTNDFLSKIDTSLAVDNLYKGKRHEGDGMFFRFAKGTGKSLFNTTEKRNLQKDLISATAEKIKSDNTLAPQEKIAVMYAVLTKVQNDIGKEHNVFASGMVKMCENLKQDIVNIAQNTENPNSEKLRNSLAEINEGKGNYKKLLEASVDSTTSKKEKKSLK